MQSSELSRPQSSNRSYVLAIATLTFALMAISFAPIFIRLSETELGANATVFNRMFIFFMVFGLGKFVARGTQQGDELEESKPVAIAKSQWWLLGSVGIISIISLVLWAISLQYTTVAKCMLLNNLTPIFTSLGSWLLFGKSFDKRFLIGMAIALTGALGLGFEDLQGGDGLLIGDLLAIASAMFLGTYFLMVEQLRTNFDATTILLWRCGVGSAMLVPIVFFTEGQFFPTTQVAIFAALGLGIVCEGFGQRLIAACLDKLSCSFVSLFLLLEPIVSALLAWVIFTEALGLTTWLGFAVVLTGIYLAQTSSAAVQEG
ncbi:DMT family transporter [[Limnothrix rosea] IAM M-220]|uniref:DMT family transporter n=1 Tax=[Limnothrix rosea] IAM M-220 TaxID=454133 RepID=UPI00095F4226|nr:DMT family transporter [[Limnothrix rosea] IAM M-220]OKH20043.1 EamA family transporter [[Limnothrix rosea] IAM M-220]